MHDTLLITRPQLDADTFARDLINYDFQVLIDPMLSIEGVDVDLSDIDEYQALVVTSANALRVLEGQFAAIPQVFDMPIFTVGSHTARFAAEAGFTTIHDAKGDVDDLIDLVKAMIDDKAKPLLYLSGEYVARPLGKVLLDVGVNVYSTMCYTQKPTNRFSFEVLEILEGLKAESQQNTPLTVTFFSKRTAETFLLLVAKHGALSALPRIKALCISDAVLKCVQHHSWAEAHVSQTPDKAGMIALIEHVHHVKTDTITGKGSAAMTSSAKNDQAIENAEEIIERFGGIRPMAKKMDVAVTTIQGWKKRDTIPARRREQVLAAAEEHGVDLSNLIEGAVVPVVSEIVVADDTPPANENDQDNQGVEVKTVEDDVSSEDDVEVEAETEVEEAVSEPTPVIELSATKPKSVERAAEHVEKKEEAPAILIEDSVLNAKLAEAEANGARRTLWINVAFILVSVAAVLVLLFPKSKPTEQPLEQQVSAVDEAVVEEAPVEKKSFLGSIIPKDLDSRISDLKEQAVALKDDAGAAIGKVQEISNDVLSEGAGTIEERAGKLQVHASEILEGERFSSLRERYDTMSSSLFGQQKLEIVSSELATIVNGLAATGLSSSSTQFNDALDGARQQSDNLGQAFDGVPAQDLKAAALLLGMSQFRQSLNRDNQPFEDDLELLVNLVGTDSPELVEALQKLAPHAQEGVLTPAGLGNEFKSIAGDVVISSLKGEDVSVKEKASARLNEILQVEKDGELLTGTPTQNVLHQANQQIESGDLQGAILTVGQLDGEEADIVQPWMNDANATLAAEQVKLFLSGDSDALKSLGLGGGAGKLIQDEKSGINILQPSGSFNQNKLYE